MLAPPSLALRSEWCGRGALLNVAHAECMQMCTAGERIQSFKGYHIVDIGSNVLKLMFIQLCGQLSCGGILKYGSPLGSTTWLHWHFPSIMLLFPLHSAPTIDGVIGNSELASGWSSSVFYIHPSRFLLVAFLIQFCPSFHIARKPDVTVECNGIKKIAIESPHDAVPKETDTTSLTRWL